MTEKRQHAILFAATLIISTEGFKPNPGKEFFIGRVIQEAASILEDRKAVAIKRCQRGATVRLVETTIVAWPVMQNP